MKSPYDLITITPRDLEAFEENNLHSKVWTILFLILEELPTNLQHQAGFIAPTLTPIPGFRDDKIRGYEITIKENKNIQKFVREFVPFFILKKC